MKKTTEETKQIILKALNSAEEEYQELSSEAGNNQDAEYFRLESVKFGLVALYIEKELIGITLKLNWRLKP